MKPETTESLALIDKWSTRSSGPHSPSISSVSRSFHSSYPSYPLPWPSSCASDSETGAEVPVHRGPASASAPATPPKSPSASEHPPQGPQIDGALRPGASEGDVASEGQTRSEGLPERVTRYRVGFDWPPTKRCETCGECKPRSEFKENAATRNGGARDGLRKSCRACEVPRSSRVRKPGGRPCAACQKWRLWDEFATPPEREDGRECICRSCSEGPQQTCGYCKKTLPASAFPARNFQGLWRCRSCRWKADYERYERAVRNGRCRRHKDRQAVPGTTSCAECRDYDRLRAARVRAAKKRKGARSAPAAPTHPTRED
jgi:hypothetical protein